MPEDTKQYVHRRSSCCCCCIACCRHCRCMLLFSVFFFSSLQQSFYHGGKRSINAVHTNILTHVYDVRRQRQIPEKYVTFLIQCIFENQQLLHVMWCVYWFWLGFVGHAVICMAHFISIKSYRVKWNFVCIFQLFAIHASTATKITTTTTTAMKWSANSIQIPEQSCHSGICNCKIVAYAQWLQTIAEWRIGKKTKTLFMSCLIANKPWTPRNDKGKCLAKTEMAQFQQHQPTTKMKCRKKNICRVEHSATTIGSSMCNVWCCINSCDVSPCEHGGWKMQPSAAIVWVEAHLMHSQQPYVRCVSREQSIPL